MWRCYPRGWGWGEGPPKEEEVGRHMSSQTPGQRPVEEVLMGSPDPDPWEGGRCEHPATVSARTVVKGGPSHLPSKQRKPHSRPHQCLRGHFGRDWQRQAMAPGEPCLGLMGSPALGTDMAGRVKAGASCCLPRKGRLSTEDLC